MSRLLCGVLATGGVAMGLLYKNRNISVSSIESRFQQFSTANQTAMRPVDILASLIALDKIDAERIRKSVPPSVLSSVSAFCNVSGLVSRGEYFALCTILANGDERYQRAFYLFGRGDGAVKVSEFQQILKATACVAGEQLVTSERLLSRLFGPQHDRVLHVKDFLAFVNQLRESIRDAEFVYADVDGSQTLSIAEVRQLFLRGVNVPKLRDTPNKGKISRRLYGKFCDVLIKREEVLSGVVLCADEDATISPPILKRAARLAGVSLTDAEAATLVEIFDVNGDGRLSTDEFRDAATLQRQYFSTSSPQIDRPAGTGMQRLVSCMMQR